MKYSCLKFSQRSNEASPEFCIFHAPAGEVLAWADIPRLSHKETNGIQRAKNDYKVRAIKKFLLGDDRNTIPTAVVITLKKGVYSISDLEGGGQRIEIHQDAGSGAFVVDGQHRLYGLNEYDKNAQVPVVAILDASDEERAFQFIVINNKVSKVAADHIRALTLNFTNPEKEQGLESRLNSARLSLNKNIGYVGMANTGDDSPFRGLVALPDTPPENQLVVPASIEASIAYIQSKNLILGSDEHAAYDLFSTVWSTIKKSWPDAFSEDKRSKLLTKVGVQCMTQYVIDNLDVISTFVDSSIDLTNAEDVDNAVQKILEMQEEKFWIVPWAISISDTKSVRDQLHESLRKVQKNIKTKNSWQEDVPVLEV
ncbi:DGQHR domain-containing protein [Marinobacter sp. EN3]|jgi:DGQHR domain-containing protein|uniref:DGQHR domain-containing protein n=1 Tax=Marinobacter sp. EN3 TaxID=1397533 RepID=UPI0004BB9FF2|nr:DGQHR domain-containing protein [Marinobacter sp. EN3]